MYPNDHEFTHTVEIQWNPRLETEYAWNEVCARAMEMFGLPGHRYITEANINNMVWKFRDPNDALIMRLKFSEHT